MIKEFLSGYVSLLRSAAVVLLLLAAGIVICFSFVWPLWYIATEYSGTYTILAIVFFAILLFFSIFNRISSHIQRCTTRHDVIRYIGNLAVTWAWRLVLAACLLGCFFFVLREQKLLALLLLFLLVILYGIYASGKKKRRADQ